jgi:enoyl-CoA hydratase/carnithine racemase
MELLLTGDRVGAQSAHEMGLAWKVVPRTELMHEARQLAVRLLQAAPLAARATKEVATRGRSLPWVEAVRFGETMRRVAAGTEDASEGLAAARERRNPNWRGR